MNLVSVLVGVSFAFMVGCAPLSHEQRPARPTLDCAHAVLRSDVPEAASDEVKHCLASAYIAKRCSVGEAYLLGLAKELKDAVGPGDLEWRDWRADRAGVRCARTSDSDVALRACCGSVAPATANR